MNLYNGVYLVLGKSSKAVYIDFEQVIIKKLLFREPTTQHRCLKF